MFTLIANPKPTIFGSNNEKFQIPLSHPNSFIFKLPWFTVNVQLTRGI